MVVKVVRHQEKSNRKYRPTFGRNRLCPEYYCSKNFNIIYKSNCEPLGQYSIISCKTLKRIYSLADKITRYPVKCWSTKTMIFIIYLC